MIMSVKVRGIGRRKRILDEQKREERSKDDFNQGRESENNRWCKRIDERIRELEVQVGIPELRRLRERVRLRWGEVKKDKDSWRL